MDDFALAAFREREARQILKRRAFYLHLSIYAAVQVFFSDTVARGTWGRAIERGVVDTRDLAEVRRIAKRLFRRAKQAARLRLQRVAA